MLRGRPFFISQLRTIFLTIPFEIDFCKLEKATDLLTFVKGQFSTSQV